MIAGPGSSLAGTGTLLRLILRRDRIRTPIWLIAITAFVPYCFTEMRTAFPTTASLQHASGFTSGPMLALFGGPGYGMSGDELSYDTFFAGIYAAYFMLAAAVMSILLVSRHTRVEEQTGRAELVRANVCGQHSYLAATTLAAVITNVALGVLIFAALLASSAPVAGSAVLAAGIAAFGLIFVAVTVAAVQISEYSAAASGISAGVLAGAFVLRAAGDMIGDHGSALSWITPFAWSQQTRAFATERWWPLAISLVVFIALLAAGFYLSTVRDLGAGLRASAAGRPGAGRWLASTPALAWRLNRTSIISWLLAMIAAGAVYGSTAEPLLDSLRGNSSAFTQLLTAQGSLLSGYLNLVVVIMVITIAIFEFLAINKVRSEESTGRTEAVLATGVSKPMWLGCHLLLVSLAAVAMLIASCTALGLVAASGTGDSSLTKTLVLTGLVYSPALVIIAGLSAACFGIHPRLLGLAALVLVFSGLSAVFGELLDLPSAAMAISPWHHTPAYPADPVTAAPLVIQLLVWLALSVLALWAYRHRDLTNR